MKNNPLLFIVAGLVLALAGIFAVIMGELDGTTEGTALIGILAVLACSTIGYGVIRWREEQDSDAATF